jgi:hypothetical protein
MNDKLTGTLPDTAPEITPAGLPDRAPDHPAIERLRETLAGIEMDVLTSYTLADAIREGSSVTRKNTGGWIEGDNACALGAGYLAAKARGYVS